MSKIQFDKLPLRDQVVLAEKQMQEIRRLFGNYIVDNEIDPNVVAATLISLLATAIAGEVGHDEAKQDKIIEFVATGIRVSLAENNFREFDAGMADAIPPWEKN